MKTKILLLLCVAGLVACATKPTKPSPLDKLPSSLADVEFISTWSNPVLGLVDDKNPELNKDRDACRNDVYKSGVNVNGEIITDQSRLNKILSEYQSQFVRQQLKKPIGTRKAESVAADATEYSKDAPSYLTEINRKQKQFVNCFQIHKKYTLVKTDTYDKKTGELLFTTDYSKK